MTMHHIISDGWSMQVMLDETSPRCIAALPRAAMSQLPAAKRALRRLRQSGSASWLERRRARASVGLLARALGCEQPVLELPADRPRPAECDATGERHAFVLPEDLADTLRHTARAHDATLFMLFLASFDTLLYRSAASATCASACRWQAAPRRRPKA